MLRIPTVWVQPWMGLLLMRYDGWIWGIYLVLVMDGKGGCWV